ncbi:MAG: CinA family protein [Robiginitomaculum sp.]
MSANLQTQISCLARLVVRMAIRHGKTIATAESCTGGWIGKALTEIPGSSSAYMGGFITYSDEAKTNLLGIPKPLIKANGAVSTPVAQAMALGAMTNMLTDIAVSVTGIAGPDGGTDAKPVGTMCFGLSTPDSITEHHEYFENKGRDYIRMQSVVFALELLLKTLKI